MYACKTFPCKISCRNHTLLSAVFCHEKSPSSKNNQDQNLHHIESVWKLTIFTLLIVWEESKDRDSVRNLAWAQHRLLSCVSLKSFFNISAEIQEGPTEPYAGPQRIAGVIQLLMHQRKVLEKLLPSKIILASLSRTGLTSLNTCYSQDGYMASGWELAGPWPLQNMDKVRLCLQCIEVP